jgi:hypothetical protein
MPWWFWILIGFCLSFVAFVFLLSIISLRENNSIHNSKCFAPEEAPLIHSTQSNSSSQSMPAWIRSSNAFSILSLAPPTAKGTSNSLQYAVLRNNNLFIYRDERQTECIAALWVDDCTVFLEWNFPVKLRADELFCKEFPLALVSRNGSLVGPDSSVLYLHFCNGWEKEEWYYRLSKVKPKHLPVGNWFAGIEDHEYTLVNALIQRAFWEIATGKTDILLKGIRAKFERKCEICPLPAFLSDVSIEALWINEKKAPLLEHIQIHKLGSVNGDISFWASLDWIEGEATVRASCTVHTDKIPVFSKLGAYKVAIQVMASISHFKGRVYCQWRAPPSNRLWISFLEPPNIKVKVQPVIGSQPIRINWLLNWIEKKIVDSITESMVYPAGEDLVLIPNEEQEHCETEVESSRSSVKSNNAFLPPLYSCEDGTASVASTASSGSSSFEEQAKSISSINSNSKYVSFVSRPKNAASRESLLLLRNNANSGNRNK